MSRSNPTNGSQNPSKRWHEWDGANGGVTYYDKASKQSIAVDLPFTFLLLDELATVKGWHENSKSGIFSNEVRDSRVDSFTVKAFKGGVIAEGTWEDIRAMVKEAGGRFHGNLYSAFKLDGELHIGSLLFKGAALNAWIEFKKKNIVHIYKKAVSIVGSKKEKNGAVVYHVPTFSLVDVTPETNAAAVALDEELQKYLGAYLVRPRGQDSHVEDIPVPTEAPPEEPEDGLPF